MKKIPRWVMLPVRSASLGKLRFTYSIRGVDRIVVDLISNLSHRALSWGFSPRDTSTKSARL